MKNSLTKDIARALRNSAIAVKGCYFPGCSEKSIKAHSISNARLLLRLSDNGKVMYFDKEHTKAGTLVETGRGVASTFGGFCGTHDKIFLPIDAEDYITGDAKQCYLFAMRASAKELSTKLTVQHTFNEQLQEGILAGYPIDTTALEYYREGLDIGTQDLQSFRKIFTDTFPKSKFGVIETTEITADRELPMAVCSTFNIELSPDGKIINDLSPSGYGSRVKPCFITVFPQNGKTYCLLSYFRRDRRDFEFLKELSKGAELEKEVLISNLITVYTENFVMNPSHWQKLEEATKSKYAEIYENSMFSGPRKFVFDESFTLFL